MAKGSKAYRAQLRRAAKRSHGGALPVERVAEMVRHGASGAAGIHADQLTRKLNAAGRTNRVGSRNSAKRAAISEW